MDQLSNYELLDLLTSYGSDSGVHFMNFLAVCSAYLLTAYFAAEKLGKLTMALLSALLVSVTLMTAIGQYVTQMAVIDLANEIATRGMATGPGISTTVKLLSGGSGRLATVVSPAIQVVSCIGSVVFAFSRANGASHGHAA